MKKINTATEVFVTKLQTLYDIEKQLEKALPLLAKAASDPELTKGFLEHLEETKNHSVRLEQIFTILDEPIQKLKCEGIRGIVEDGSWVIKSKAPENLKDAMLASAARYAEHYEMAGYMSAILEAEILGLTEVVELLNDTLQEEQTADEKLELAMQTNFKKSQ